ncbi:hypothetical protein GCM10027577_28620 [Spirosoma fluminis]
MAEVGLGTVKLERTSQSTAMYVMRNPCADQQLQELVTHGEKMTTAKSVISTSNPEIWLPFAG